VLHAVLQSCLPQQEANSGNYGTGSGVDSDIESANEDSTGLPSISNTTDVTLLEESINTNATAANASTVSMAAVYLHMCLCTYCIS
jgi:hypothetical protein